MRTGYDVEQIFVRARGEATEVALVLVAPSGATKRESMRVAGRDRRRALEQAARGLALRPDLAGVRSARLRVETPAGLVDDAVLLAAFVAAFDAA